MALIQCEECGREISDRAPACPHCGVPRVAAPAPPLAPAAPSPRSRSGCGTLIALCLMALIGYGCYRVVAPYPSPSTPAAVALPASPPQDTDASPARWTHVGGQGDMHFVVVEPPHDSQAPFQQAVASICAGKTHCFVHFWGSTSAAPRALPMTDAQVEDEMAAYRQNTRTNLARWHWKCDRFSRVLKSDCY